MINSTDIFPMMAVNDTLGYYDTCLVVGNGPSLANVRNDVLDKFVTFGANRCYLKFEPTYYVLVDEFVCKANTKWIDEINALSSKKFILEAFADKIECSTPLCCIHRIGFSFDPLNYVYAYFSVITAMMQLAYYMGFSTVILIGVDHSFTTKGKPNETIVSTGDDPNHFNPAYFGKGFRWQLPDLDTSEIAYRLAKQVYGDAGRKVLDATVEGQLTVFPKVDYRSLF